MSRRAKFEPDAIFASLVRHEVRFVLIGGLAGGARGAAWPTFDADILIEDSEENLVRLDTALRELGAQYDTPHQPPLLPDLRLLSSGNGPQLFRTRHGRLDVLKEAGGEPYETLLRAASELDVHGAVIRCASLAALLRMKRAANRPKAQAAIAKIEAALRELEG